MEDLTEEQKAAERIAIAKDVLAQLAAQRIKAIFGKYLITDDPAFNMQIDAKLAEPLAPPKACQACAIGSVFICALDKHNELMAEDVATWRDWGVVPDDGGALVLSGDTMTDYLCRWFSKRQLNLMEVAFEGSDVNGYFEETGELDWDDGEIVGPADMLAALSFRGNERDPNAVLARIVQNVIDNGGTFRPEVDRG